MFQPYVLRVSNVSEEMQMLRVYGAKIGLDVLVLHMFHTHVANVESGCCMFNEMFHVDFKCLMQHKMNVAVGSFSSSMDGSLGGARGSAHARLPWRSPRCLDDDDEETRCAVGF
jgi:hypothetical protein